MSTFDNYAVEETRTRIPTATATPGQEKLAACLSGLLVGAVAGTVIGRLTGKSWSDVSVVIGVAAGAVLGLLVLRRIASFQTILGGAAFGAFLPVALCVIDGFRRGRFKDIGRDIQDAKFFLVLGCMLAGGAAFGILLVGIKKLILLGLVRPAREDAEF